MVWYNQLMYNPYELKHKAPTKKDFIDTTDFDQSEILDIIKTATTVRGFLKSGGTLKALYHKTLAMLFEQRSTRTRVSFEVGMEQLGGHALNLDPGSIQLGSHETVGDTAKVLSRMCDMIMARVNRHEDILALAAESTVPVINGMSDYNHPTQEIGDIITIFDNLPEGKTLDKVSVVFVGDCTQVCASLMMICSKMGMQFTQYAPPAKWLSDDYLKIGRANNQNYGGSVHVSDNPYVLENADFIYTDVWYGLYDKETPKDVYMRDFYPKYQVNEEMLAATGNPNVKFMHCLPANRGEEVTDAVLDGPNSLAWDEAENRLTAQRGLLLYFSGAAQEALGEIKTRADKEKGKEK